MNRIKKLMASIIVISILASNCVCILAVESEQSQKIINEWIEEDGTYQYPVRVTDEEWNYLSTRSDMVEATQIPDEILETISTEDLIQLIIEYPLLCHLNAYSTLEEGYEVIKSEFNAINELLSRNDCYTKLISMYQEYEIPTERIVNYDNLLSEDNYINDLNALLHDSEYIEQIIADGKVYDAMNILEFMIMDLYNSGQLNQSDTDLLVQAYLYKLEEKIVTEYYESQSATTLLNKLIETESDLVEAFAIEPEMDAVEIFSSSTYTIYTPNGTAVQCTYNSTLENGDASEYASLVTAYNGTVIATSYKNYNCHSFAWLQSLYPSMYQYLWLNNISAFVNDSNYTYESTPTSPGRIATWWTHSGIVSQISKSNPHNHGIPEPYLVSKWATGPVVAHFQTRNPYYGGSETVSYYY